MEIGIRTAQTRCPALRAGEPVTWAIEGERAGFSTMAHLDRLSTKLRLPDHARRGRAVTERSGSPPHMIATAAPTQRCCQEGVYCGPPVRWTVGLGIAVVPTGDSAPARGDDRSRTPRTGNWPTFLRRNLGR